MSQSRFSIVLVGVSALLRRPLVSRLRPAGFPARGSGGFRRSALPSVSEFPLGGLAFGLPFRRLPLGGLTFGLTASAFRRAPLRSCPRRVGSAAFRFGVALAGLTFGLTASAFRHAPLRRLPSASWPSGSLLPLFGTHRSAPPHRRREGRRNTTTRQLFHFKTLIPTC